MIVNTNLGEYKEEDRKGFRTPPPPPQLFFRESKEEQKTRILTKIEKGADYLTNPPR